jgi:hypothetical protein
MDDKITGVGAPSGPVVSALQRILRPFVRFLLTQGITFTYLTDLLKSAYVSVAAEEFGLDGKKQTDSRISLLTGVHRKDVKRLAHETTSGSAPPPNVSLGAQLVARWVSRPEFLDENGQPLPLPRLASDGGARSFEGLVASVSKDIRSRVVLDEWLRMRVARIDAQDRVCLNVAAFIPENGFTEKLFFFGQNLHDHMAAAVHNLSGPGQPFIERSVYYDELSPASIRELADLSAELGMQALQTINRRAMELERGDAENKRPADLRMNFGIYFYSGRREDQAGPSDEN